MCSSRSEKLEGDVKGGSLFDSSGSHLGARTRVIDTMSLA